MQSLRKSRIVLINPPAPYLDEPAMNPPLGLLYISSFLKSKGFKHIVLIDYQLFSYSLNMIPEADIYGITCITPQYRWFKEIARYIKKHYKKARVIGGGHHVTYCFDEVKEEVDEVIKGDGEHALYSYMNGYTSPDRWMIHDIDFLPMPDRDLLNPHLYKRTINGEKAVHIITARGCPYKCHYCANENYTYRIHSVEYVMAEIDSIMNKYGIDSFVIYDDIFTLNKRRVADFCEQFRKRRIKWRCWSRTNSITLEMLTLMKNSGLQSITYGVESGDETILSNINKKATVDDNYNAIIWAKCAGVPVRCSLMYGNPGENIKTIKNTVKFVEDTQPDEWHLAVLMPIPGSHYWDSGDVRFDKEALKKDDYLSCNRYHDSGVGQPIIEIDSMDKKQFRSNLKYFISELERVCSRSKIQDTSQKIKVGNL